MTAEDMDIDDVIDGVIDDTETEENITPEESAAEETDDGGDDSD